MLTMCVSGYLNPVQLQPQLDKGLVFLKDRDILITGQKWTIVLEVGIDDYVYVLRGMKVAVDAIQLKLHALLQGDTDDRSVYQSEVTRIISIMKDLSVDIDSFEALLPENVTITLPLPKGKDEK